MSNAIPSTRVKICSVTIFLAVAWANCAKSAWGISALIPTSQSPKIPSVATASADHNVRCWTDQAKPGIQFLAHEGAVNCIIATNDGKLITAGEDKLVKIWNNDGQLESAFDPPHDKAALCLAFNSQSRTLASGGADGKVKLWNSQTGRLLTSISAHIGAVKCLAWSPDGSLLAAGGSDRIIQLWKQDGKPAGTIIGNDDTVSTLAWASDSRTLVSGSADGYLQAWSVMDFAFLAKVKAHSKAVTCVTFSPNGKILASSGTDGKLRLWNLSITQFSDAGSCGGDKGIYSIAWSRDGSVLVSGGADKIVHFWKFPGLMSISDSAPHDGSILSLCITK